MAYILQKLLLAFLPVLAFGLTPRERFENLKKKDTPFLETYWESYTSFPYNYNTCYSHDSPIEIDLSDFGVDLGSIPIVSGTSDRGVNVVNIAFAAAYEYCMYSFSQCSPYICGLNLFAKDDLDGDRFLELKKKISLLQSKGAFVKLAAGGQEYGNTHTIYETTYGADIVVNKLVESVKSLGLDGIDLNQNEGSGAANFRANDLSSVQLYMAKQLRKQLPDHIISYTFPGDYVNFPFRDVVEYGHEYFDSITAYRANEESMAELEALGVPRNKLVWGVAIGCNNGEGIYPTPDVSVIDAGMVALKVAGGNYAGAMTWSVNRDTNHRTDVYGECNLQQTGEPDGTYILLMSSLLNN